MPRIIRYYLDEAPILPNVETPICREPDGLADTLANLERAVHTGHQRHKHPREAPAWGQE